MPKRRKSKKRKKSAGKLKKAIKLLLLFAIILSLMFAVSYFADKIIEQNSYSMEYKAQILKYSSEYGLDPALVAAVVHCESSHKADAVSNKGAMGLMQIMPRTGKWVAGKLDIENYNDDMLLDADINIEMGCWYLKFLQERFNGEFVNYIAAYNAGHGKVEEWLEDDIYSKDGVLVEIPYDETREYVKKVGNAMEKYGELYAGAF